MPFSGQFRTAAGLSCSEGHRNTCTLGAFFAPPSAGPMDSAIGVRRKVAPGNGTESSIAATTAAFGQLFPCP